MPSYKLIYWNGRGRGELPRLVFAAAGEKYEDFRFDEKQWPSIKPTTPFGVAPVLEVDGKQLPDSLSIAKYLANKFGLAGSGEWEQALVDSILQTTADIIGHSATIFYAEEAQKARRLMGRGGRMSWGYADCKESSDTTRGGYGFVGESDTGPLTKKLLDEILPQFFEHMEKFIEKNGKDGYVVGSKMTVADLALFNTIDLAEHTYKAGTLDKSAKFPKVKAVCDKVANHEKISPYLKERPVSEF